MRLGPRGSTWASLSWMCSMTPCVKAHIQRTYSPVLASSTACQRRADCCSPGHEHSCRPVEGTDIAKALPRKCQCVHGFSWPWGWLSCPKMGAVWRPHFWGRLMSFHMNWGQFLGPSIWHFLGGPSFFLPIAPRSPASPLDFLFLDRFLFRLPPYTPPHHRFLFPLRKERKRVQKELKKAEKRRTRLRKCARQLSDPDLVAVLHMRERQTTRCILPKALLLLQAALQAPLPAALQTQALVREKL